MIEEEQGRIDYDECGSGPAAVLLPGSCSIGAAWRPIIAAWGNRFRCVTTSLLGYGGTSERRTVGDPSISRNAEAMESVIRRTGGRVHLVGHSFGGLVALGQVLRRCSAPTHCFLNSRATPLWPRSTGPRILRS